MFRRLLLVSSIAFGAIIAPSTIAQANLPVTEQCKQPATGPESVKQLIICVAPKFGISTSHALYIAYRESRYQPGAQNPDSTACGVYQDLDARWNEVVSDYLYGHKLGPITCVNGRMNVFLNLRYVKHHGWGPWGG